MSGSQTINSSRDLLLNAYAAALTAVDGRRVVAERLRREALSGPVQVIALGKAAEAMALGARDVLGEQITNAFLVSKTGSGVLPWGVHEGGHPIPDDRSLEAGRALDNFLSELSGNSTVLVLLSGGASSLVEQLPPGITLPDLQRVNEWLLGSGLDIHAMNRVRRRLSRLKGGQLAARLAGHRVLGLVISDVPSDDLQSIASGPLTVPGTDDGLPTGLPGFIEELLARVPVTIPGRQANNRLLVERVATNTEARRGAVDWATSQGVQSRLYVELITGDAELKGREVAQALLESPPGLLHVWGGEATVHLPPRPGRGGRGQHLALSAALTMSGHEDLFLLVAGSDGFDGPGEDAGALVDGGTVVRGESLAGSATAALARADAGTFLEASGDLIQTGPTGTNVMDLILGWRRG